jgi:membrane protein involved in D-alanine export
VRPYGDLPYFIVILLVGLPAALAGWFGRSRAPWIGAATVVMALVHFGLRQTELAFVVAYAALQLGLVTGFSRWRRRHRGRLVFALAILASAAPLVLFKVVAVFRPGTPVGFLGISYVTFRAIDALIVIGDGLEHSIHPRTYLSFLFFPATISAGPIDRYRRFTADAESISPPSDFRVALDHGVALCFRGLLYKFVFAALIQGELLTRLDRAHTVLGTIGYMYAYSAFLFFDFAGYSAIAIGVSRQSGILTPPNFDRPFLAANIAEFWARWHLSLSGWFRDHVYMRFVMAGTRGRWFGGSRYVTSSLALLLTFGLMGAWHGLEVRYLVYGLYHAVLLIAHQATSRSVRRRWPVATKSRAWHWLAVLVTFNAVCFGFLIFSGRLG